jgi:hypothetical protein
MMARGPRAMTAAGAAVSGHTGSIRLPRMAAQVRILGVDEGEGRHGAC